MKMQQSSKEALERPVKPFLKKLYEDHYKKLLLIPIFLLVLSIAQIAYQSAKTGDFVNKGISLKGGLVVTIPAEKISKEKLESLLKKELDKSSEVSLRLLGKEQIILEAAGVQTQQMVGILEKLGLKREEYSMELTGSLLGQSFFKIALRAVLGAFLLMAIVVFLFFRSFVPSVIAIYCVICDIIVTLAVFNLTGIKLTTAGVAAFLMLIGYSIDTDMLLSTNVLRRKEGSVMERIYSAIRTGLTMTTTTLAAILVGLIFITADTVRQIMLITLIGLLVDMIYTWIQNVGLLRLYLELKERKNVQA
ncbi:MAG: hypothetical protein QW559_03295 [Candidatus Woesearchaeota archaeon]